MNGSGSKTPRVELILPSGVLSLRGEITQQPRNRKTKTPRAPLELQEDEGLWHTIIWCPTASLHIIPFEAFANLNKN